MSNVALVTGSSRSIGKAIAIQLAKDGFDVIVHSKNNKEKSQAVAKEVELLGQKAYVVQGDITKEENVAAIFDQIQKEIGQLDLLVNNAAFDYGYKIEDYTLEQMRYVMDSILFSRMATTKYALPLLKQSQSPNIINIASRMGGPKTVVGVGAYAPAEAGIIKFSQCCALEFAEYKIRVNCVAPGLTDTDMTRGLYSNQDFWDGAATKNPSGRVGQAQDVANAVAFLASDKSSYINGSVIEVNGGSNLG